MDQRTDFWPTFRLLFPTVPFVLFSTLRSLIASNYALRAVIECGRNRGFCSKLPGSVFPEGHFRSRHGNPIKWSRYVSSAGSGSLFYLFSFRRSQSLFPELFRMRWLMGICQVRKAGRKGGIMSEKVEIYASWSILFGRLMSMRFASRDRMEEIWRGEK